jgi:hypothetical protein
MGHCHAGVLRSLLLEGGQHSVELWEGYGANWTLVRWGRGRGRRGGEGAGPVAGAVAGWEGPGQGQRQGQGQGQRRRGKEGGSLLLAHVSMLAAH